jgi:hypothetical protein
VLPLVEKLPHRVTTHQQYGLMSKAWRNMC